MPDVWEQKAWGLQGFDAEQKEEPVTEPVKEQHSNVFDDANTYPEDTQTPRETLDEMVSSEKERHEVYIQFESRRYDHALRLENQRHDSRIAELDHMINSLIERT